MITGIALLVGLVAGFVTGLLVGKRNPKVADAAAGAVDAARDVGNPRS